MLSTLTKIVIYVKGEYKHFKFMLLFIHLLYLIWGKTLCFNRLRGTSWLWYWCWQNFWMWHFLLTLQNDSHFAFILINYESVKFFLKFFPLFLKVF